MAIQIVLAICLLVFVLYFAFLSFSCILWSRTVTLKLNGTPNFKVSVIVAARNEADNIPALLNSLSVQDYPAGLVEIIIINDLSTDSTLDEINKFSGRKGINLKVYSTESGSNTPKKDALRLGVKNASGDLLFFTDADCILPQSWIRSMSISFLSPETGLVFGPIKYSNSNSLEKVLSVEQAALLGSSVSSLAIGIPSMCNGANMAVRRSVYEKVNGFTSDSKIASGDDELLMHKVFETGKNTVAFCKSSGAIVSTAPAGNLKELFNQRLRWAGKWEKYRLLKTKAFALFIFSFHVCWIMAILLLTASGMGKVMAVAVLVKATAEFVFIFPIMKFLDKKINLSCFILLQLIYSPYVVFFGLISRRKGYYWKERKLN